MVKVLSHLWYYYAYMIRNKILDEVREEYVFSGKSQGAETKDGSVPALPAEYDSVVSWHHGHFCSGMLGGTYIVETVFSYPGIGNAGV